MNISSNLSVWTAFILTCAVFSGLYRENIFYKFAESVFIGVSAGYFACLLFFSVIFPSFESILNGKYILFIPIVAGLFSFLSLTKNRMCSKIFLIPASFIVTIYFSINLYIYFKEYVYEMFVSSIIPLVHFYENGELRIDKTINSIVSITGTVTVLWFFVSRQYKFNKIQSLAGETGRFYLLVAIGASFGYTLVSRIVLVLGRFDFIINDLLGF